MPTTKLTHVYLTLFLAYLMLLLPWSDNAVQIMPDFPLVVLIYWMMRAPQLCNVGTAWFVGLLVDLATGGVFGQHAWAYTLTAFFTVLYQRRLVLFNGMQQFFYVFLMLLIAQLTLLVLRSFAGMPFAGWIYFLPSFTGVLLWRILLMINFQKDPRAGQA
jgi:rod shape-determining protein MreD